MRIKINKYTLELAIWVVLTITGSAMGIAAIWHMFH